MTNLRLCYRSLAVVLPRPPVVLPRVNYNVSSAVVLPRPPVVLPGIEEVKEASRHEALSADVFPRPSVVLPGATVPLAAERHTRRCLRKILRWDPETKVYCGGRIRLGDLAS